MSASLAAAGRFDGAMVDLDGTMVDTLGDFVAALNLMLDDLGLGSVNRVQVERLVGKGSEHLIKSVLFLVGAGNIAPNNIAIDKSGFSVEALFPVAWQRYQHHYLAVNGQFSQVYPGVIDGLQVLKKRGLKLACLTNKPIIFADALLRVKRLHGFFDVSFGGDAFERKKPDPLPLIKTCAALGTAPIRTLMIGDSSNDAQAARAAGCPVLLMTYGYNHGEPVRGVDADGFLDSLAEVGQFI